MISADKAAQITASAVQENDVTRERLAEYEDWFKTSSITKDPGGPTVVPLEEFNLTEHCKLMMQQKVEMSYIDI